MCVLVPIHGSLLLLWTIFAVEPCGLFDSNLLLLTNILVLEDHKKILCLFVTLHIKGREILDQFYVDLLWFGEHPSMTAFQVQMVGDEYNVLSESVLGKNDHCLTQKGANDGCKLLKMKVLVRWNLSLFLVAVLFLLLCLKLIKYTF